MNLYIDNEYESLFWQIFIHATSKLTSRKQLAITCYAETDIMKVLTFLNDWPSLTL